MVQQKVWQTNRIQVSNNKIQCDHDYPTKIVQKCKTYLGIKKASKEKGIHFQTPYTKIRIHFVKSYDNVGDAAQDMRTRGLTVDVLDTEEMTRILRRDGNKWNIANQGWIRWHDERRRSCKSTRGDLLSNILCKGKKVTGLQMTLTWVNTYWTYEVVKIRHDPSVEGINTMGFRYYSEICSITDQKRHTTVEVV